MNYVPPSAPQPIGGVIDDAIRLFRASWSRCWYLAIIPGIASMLFALLLSPTVPPVAANPQPSLAAILQTFAMIFTPRLIAFYLLLVIVTIIFQGAVLAREAAIASGNQTFTAADAIGTGLRRALWMIVGAILFVIAVTIGFFAFVIPGIWLWGRLMFWTPALFVDDQNALDGLGTSWRLTRGNWWRGTVIVTVAFIIAIVLYFVFTFVGGAVGGILVSLSHTGLRGTTLIIQVSSTIAGALYYPLIAAMWIATYRDFKLRRQGGDLASRAAALGSAA